MHWIPSELRSETCLGESSTRMGDLLGSPRVAPLFCVYSSFFYWKFKVLVRKICHFSEFHYIVAGDNLLYKNMKLNRVPASNLRAYENEDRLRYVHTHTDELLRTAHRRIHAS